MYQQHDFARKEKLHTSEDDFDVLNNSILTEQRMKTIDENEVVGVGKA